jgi:hypothetical protein
MRAVARSFGAAGASTGSLSFRITIKLLPRETGKGLYAFSGRSFAHVVRVDARGDIWCVDEGSNMVAEFDPAGRVVLMLGRKPEPKLKTHPRLFWLQMSVAGISTGA